MSVSRRLMLWGAGGVAVIAAAGGALFEGRRLFRKHYPPTAYDDLLARLGDRDAAAQIGEAVLADEPDFDIPTTVDRMRARLVGRNLVRVSAEDAAAGRVVEADNWVLPETLAQICALAARAAG